MSDQLGGISARDLIWPIVVMFVALVVGIVALALFLPETRDVTAIVTPLFATFTSLSVMVGGWVVVRRVTEKVDRVQEVVETTSSQVDLIKEQTNGKTDAQVREIAVQSAIRALERHTEREGETP